jgi:integrase
MTCGWRDLSEAWQNGLSVSSQQADRAAVVDVAEPAATSEENKRHSFREVVDHWRKMRYPMCAVGTRVHYDQLLALHFDYMMDKPINDITPRVIDDWLALMKKQIGRTGQSMLRKSFDKELTLLGVILRHYDEYFEDPVFRFPIKKRHRTDAVVKRDAGQRDRDLPYEDFLKVLAVARTFEQGQTLEALMTVQYRQALRVSEGCALHWEDVRLDFRNPENSVIRVSKHMEWTRKRGMQSVISLGYKNSRAAGAVKELPMFPEVFKVLRAMYYVGAKGLIFKNRSGTFFSYRQVQDLYERAFKKAGVEFTGTHSLRHGGCRAVYNETGDIALAGQILGNEDSDTVKVYARRDRSALKRLVGSHWEKSRSESELHELARTGI